MISLINTIPAMAIDVLTRRPKLANITGGLTQRLTELVAITVVGVLVGLLLTFARQLELVLKEKGLSILGKLTGMYLVALAAQIIFTGILGLLTAGR